MSRRWLATLDLAFAGFAAAVFLFLGSAALWRGSQEDPVELRPAGLASAHLIRTPGTNTFTAHLVVQSGEIDNTGPEGLAHYVEHLAWLGMSGAEDAQRSAASNAWTNHLATVYWISGATEDAEDNLIRLSRVLEPIRISESQAAEERGIVVLEQQRGGGDPWHATMEAAYKSLHDGAPLGRSVIGVPEDIRRFDLAEAQRFHARTHTPANSALIITGAVSARHAQRLVTDIFGGMDASASVERTTQKTAIPSRDVSEERGANHHGVTVLYTKIAAIAPRGDLAGLLDEVSLLEDILASELPGGLPGALRADQLLGSDFDLHLDALGGDHVVIEIQARPGRGISGQQLLEHIEREIGHLAEADIPAETFERLRTRAEKRLGDRVEPQPLLERSLMLLQRRIPVETVADQRQRLENVRVDDLDTLLDAIAGPGRVVARLLGPDRSEG